MIDAPTLGLIGIIAAAIIAGFFGLRAAMTTAKVNKEGNAVTFSKNLMDRVESLEDDVRDLKKELKEINRVFTTALNFIEKLWLWAHDGSKPPIPDVPTSLREHLDPALFREHVKQQDRLNP